MTIAHQNRKHIYLKKKKIHHVNIQQQFSLHQTIYPSGVVTHFGGGGGSATE